MQTNNTMRVTSIREINVMDGEPTEIEGSFIPWT